MASSCSTDEESADDTVSLKGIVTAIRSHLIMVVCLGKHWHTTDWIETVNYTVIISFSLAVKILSHSAMNLSVMS